VKSRSAWSSLLVFQEESTLYKYRQKVGGRREREDQETLLFSREKDLPETRGLTTRGRSNPCNAGLLAAYAVSARRISDLVKIRRLWM